jgi:membrane fusion protein (multidrug efflux system)
MKKPYGWILFLVAGIFFSGCHRQGGGGSGGGASKAPSRPEANIVTVATVTNVAWDRTVSIVGTLFPKDEALVSAQVEGMVEKTVVDFGDRVKAGQELAEIDTKTYEANLQAAIGNTARSQAAISRTKQNFERVQQLAKAQVSSSAEFDQAKADYEQALADLKATQAMEAVARLNLEHSHVLAPFDGGVAQRQVGRGDFVKVGSPLFNVVNDFVLKFIFGVPERYGSFVKKELPVTFTVDNYPGETFTGTVYLISPQVNTANRTFSVGALVTNVNFKLKANTFARGSLVVEKAVPTPVVPLPAVVNFAGVTKVFVIENNVAHSRSVKIGRIQNGAQEVLEGVKEGEVVATSGLGKLTEGAAVTLQSPAGRAGETAPQLAAANNRTNTHERH